MLDNLFNTKNKARISNFLSLSNFDKEKNELRLKNLLRGNSISKQQEREISEILARPDSFSSVALFVEEGVLKSIKKLNTIFEGSYEGTKFFILPFFNYREKFFRKQFLLNFSLQELKLYKISNEGLVEVELEKLKDFESILSVREESKSIQHHTAQKTIFHGQNASSEKDREDSLKKQYMSTLARVLEKFLIKNKSQIIIATTGDNMDLLRNDILPEKLSPVSLRGNFQKNTEVELFDELKKSINEYSGQILNSYQARLDVSRSNILQQNSFAEIMSFVNQGRIQKVLVGELGLIDRTYQNPIAPLGMNYIAHEIHRLGGDVVYFPGEQIEHSENNLLFDFRY